MLDLEKLEQFATLARHGSYTGAAAVLHISQPTLTRAVQQLETTLGATLLDRGRNGVALTAVGATFLREAEELLRTARSIEARIALHTHGIRGHVRVGAGPGIGNSILPGVIAEVIESKPDVTVQAVLASADVMYSMLLDGDLDLFVAREPNAAWREHLDSVVVGHARADFWVRHGHPLTRKRQVTFSDIADFARIASSAWNEVVPTFAAPDLARHVRATIETDDVFLMRQIAADTDAIMITNARPVRKDFARLEIVDRGNALPGTDVVVNTVKGRTMSPAALFVNDLIIDAAREVTALWELELTATSTTALE